MSKMNESKALHDALENAPVATDIKERLASIQAFLDPWLFEQFNTRIMWIVQEYPEAQEVVASEIGKTEISISQLQSQYNQQRTAVYFKAANDENYWEDENRSYGWLWNVA